MHNREIWKPVNGYKDYLVSSHGRVKSIKFGRNLIRKTTINKNGNGYKSVVLYNNGDKKCHFVHRLVAVAFVVKPNRKEFINHKDCDKLNNHYSNLEWVTHKENIHHSIENGMTKPLDQDGVKNHMSIFDKNDVISIRGLHGKISISQIAKNRNCSYNTIWRIINNETYTNI
jgi:hypothetical protein